MEKADEIINFLNSAIKVKIAPSKIHGVGVFAIKDIPKGTKLFADMVPKVFHIPYGSIKKLFPEVREQILERWPNIVNGGAFAWPDTNIQAFMNHSDEYNYDSILDVTVNDVKKGEEITEDYRDIKNYEKVFPWLVSN
jgi:hypothetical protein